MSGHTKTKPRRVKRLYRVGADGISLTTSAQSNGRHDATVLGFSRRRRGIGIIGTAHFVPGGKLTEPAVAAATRATLHYGAETITVENIRRGDVAGAFIGRIRRFEQSRGLSHAEMKVGDDIAFEEKHVFTVGE